MIFKQYINLAIAIIIATTCGTIIAMHPNEEELRENSEDSDEVIYIPGESANLLNFWQPNTPYAAELPKLMPYFENPASPYNPDSIQSQSVKTTQIPLINNIAATITMHQKYDFNFYKPRQNVRKHKHNSRATWINNLRTGPQIPEDIQKKILVNLREESKDKVCNFGTLITLRYQYLLKGKSQGTLAKFLENQNIQASVSETYVRGAWSNINKSHPEIELIVRDLVQKYKGCPIYF